jgi:hypothetical protein
MKRRTEITIEIDRVMVISQSSSQESWCNICGSNVSMGTVTQAAEMIHSTEEVVFKLTEAGMIHVATPTEAEMLVCLDSLLACLKRNAGHRQSGY